MQKTALLVIDMQKGFDESYWGSRNNPTCEKNVELLISTFREKKLEVIHIKHDSLEENSPLRADCDGNDYKEEALPLENEKQFSKNVNSAFIGTSLKEYLEQKAINSLVIVGLTTDHCISTSTRMAGNFGFDVKLISDATATFNRMGCDGVMREAEEMHRVNLTSLNGEFCKVLSTQELLDEL